MILRAENTKILADIWLRCSLDAHGFISGLHWKSNYEAMRDEYLPRSENYVYTDGKGEVLGFISLNGGHVEALFIDIPHQGKGVGRALLDHACLLRPGRGLTVTVYSRNVKALSFYRRYGFSDFSEGEDPATGEGEITMRLEGI